MSKIDFFDGDDIVPVNVKLLYNNSKLPARAHHDDAGFDLYAVEQKGIWPGEVCLLKTGVAIELPEGYEAQVRGRSGLALKKGVFVVNGVGTIDAGYRGEIGVIVSRVGFGSHVVRPGDAIAQLVIHKLPQVRLVQAEELSETDRGQNGYGSTDQKGESS